MKLSQRPIQIPKMFLFVGPHGKGKSIGAASFPKPMCIIDLDWRIQSVANYYNGREGFNADDVDFFQYGPHNMNEFIVKMNNLEQDALNQRFKYRTVIIDSLTSLADNGLSHFIDWRGANRKASKDDDSKKSKGKSLGGIDLNTIEDFGAENRMILSLIEVGRVIPAYFILTAHQTIVEYKELGSDEVKIEKVLLTGGRKVAARIPAYFDEVYYFTSRGAPPRFICRTQSSDSDPGKTTLPLPFEIDFTGKSLYNLILSNLAGKGVSESTLVKKEVKPTPSSSSPEQPKSTT